MRIALFIGHGITEKTNLSAFGYVNEYYYLKDLVPIIAKELNEYGYECDLYIPPEYLFKNPIDEVIYKLVRANVKNNIGQYRYDLVLELHLNYSNDPLKNGTCAYYKIGDNNAYLIAKRMCQYLDINSRLINLGVSTPPLRLLKQSGPSAIVLELFYCSSKRDVREAKRLGLQRIAELIVMAINDGPYKPELAKDGKIFLRNLHGWNKDKNSLTYYNQSIKYVNTIENIMGEYYYFDKNGNISNGWKKINDNIYYFDPNNFGAMCIGCSKIIGNTKYIFDDNGVLQNDIDAEFYTNDKDCDIYIEGDVVIYDDSFSVNDIKDIHDKYPHYFIISKSDYSKYDIKFSNEVYYEKEGVLNGKH